jgi:hypothetical protein
MEVVNMVVPMTVVCGLNVCVGLRLSSTGMRDVQKLSWAGGCDCIVLAVVCALLSMICLRDNNGGNTARRRRGGGEGGDDGRREEPGAGGGGIVAGSLSLTTTATAVVAESTIASGSNGGDHSSALETRDDGVEMGMPGGESARGLKSAAELHVADAEGGTAPPTPPPSLSSRRRRPPPPRLSRFVRVAWDWVYCCLNPSPPAPHLVGMYLFLTGS